MAILTTILLRVSVRNVFSRVIPCVVCLMFHAITRQVTYRVMSASPVTSQVTSDAATNVALNVASDVTPNVTILVVLTRLCGWIAACKCVVYESFGRNEGIFTSPNFPQVYASDINCILYTFIGDFDEIVELTFIEFDLQPAVQSKSVTHSV